MSTSNRLRIAFLRAVRDTIGIKHMTDDEFTALDMLNAIGNELDARAALLKQKPNFNDIPINPFDLSNHPPATSPPNFPAAATPNDVDIAETRKIFGDLSVRRPDLYENVGHELEPKPEEFAPTTLNTGDPMPDTEIAKFPILDNDEAARPNFEGRLPTVGRGTRPILTEMASKVGEPDNPMPAGMPDYSQLKA